MIQPSTISTKERRAARVGKSAGGLRVAEKLILGFFAYAVIASIVFPVSLRERLAVMGLNVGASVVVFLLSNFGKDPRSGVIATARDWFPAVVILLSYRESGLFFVPDPSHRLDYLFIRWDSVLLKNLWVLRLLSFFSPWLQRYLEFCYFLCYPLVPLGLGGLYLAPGRQGSVRGCESDEESQGRTIDRFWTSVLLALFCCYILFPLFPSTPPRLLFRDLPGPRVRPLFRIMNFWILGQYGIQASVFPSGHVAAVTATALSVRAYLPRLGVIFLIMALSIAAATVFERYHYAADAVAGALIGLAAFQISNCVHKR